MMAANPTYSTHRVFPGIFMRSCLTLLPLAALVSGFVIANARAQELRPAHIVPAIPMGPALAGSDFGKPAPQAQGALEPAASPRTPPCANCSATSTVKARAVQDPALSVLRKEVDELKQRARVAEAVGAATQKPSRARFTGSSTVYDYREGGVYQVYGGIERVTDVALEPGEKLTGEPVGGDTVRWALSKMKTGSGANETWHVILKPMDDGIETNVLIPTDRRVYKLQLRSSLDWFMPGVRWNYPVDEATARGVANAVALRQERQTEPLAYAPEKLDFNYTIRGDDVEWKPVRVFNDGTKTFLQMPASMRAGDAPALFVVEENGEPMLVNYRVKEGMYMVDRLFKTAELRVGAHQKVVIRRDAAKRAAWKP